MDNRSEKVIKLGKTNLTIFYREGDDSFLELENAVRKGYKKLQDFFGIDLGEDIEIQLVYSREEFDKYYEASSGQKSKEWNNAFVQKGVDTKLFIFSPSVVEEFTIHKREKLQKTVVHEMVHLFINKLGFSCWVIHEGLAQYLSGQKEENPNGKEKLKKLYASSRPFNFIQEDVNYCLANGGYSAAKYFTDCLLEDFGKEKVLEILKNEKDWELYFKDFKKKTGFSLGEYTEKITA